VALVPELFELSLAAREEGAESRSGIEADARTRTGDPFITSEIRRSGGAWHRLVRSGCKQGERPNAAANFGLAR
jgi:hypothetical protein